MNEKVLKIKFTKMAGAGNDFIVIEARNGLNYKALTTKVCDRNNGIGADGLLILDKSKKADYKMRIINADGSEAEMCGNGARCLAAYIVRNLRPAKKIFSLETAAGIILAEARGEIAHVKLSEPRDYRPGVAVEMKGRTLNLPYIDTGVPHAIVFVDGLNEIDVKNIGRAIRYHDVFAPRGTNVDFVEQIADNLVQVRTYERGVEDETKACGTGAVACAIVSYRRENPDVFNRKGCQVKIKTASGEILQVSFDLKDDHVVNVWLNGSAKFIAQGEYYYRNA